ncbi:MAG: RT0821/Lpp0805 family surface protein [Rhodospirillales bacterium]
MKTLTRKISIGSVAAIALFALLLSGCVTQGNQKQVGGTLLGAGLGGWAGSTIGGGKGRLAAVAAGTLIGALVGNGIGQSLDNIDRMHADRAFSQAQYTPVGQPVVWNNPNTGHYGSVTPVREGTQQNTGAYCREYHTTVSVGGSQQSAYGTACRQPDGSWKMI